MALEIEKLSREELKKHYERVHPILLKELDLFMSDLKEKIKLFPVNISYKARIKKFDSFYIKSKRKMENGEQPFSGVGDLLAVRLICAFNEDVAIVEQFLRENFKVMNVDYKGENLSFREFGYNSTHVDIRIKEVCPIPEWKGSLSCEVQVRTILQDAWAEVEHELIYKNKLAPKDSQLKHKLAALNASLNLADIVFQEIRSFQKKYREQSEFNSAMIENKMTNLLENDFASTGDYYIVPTVIENPVGQTIDFMLLDALKDLNSFNYDLAITKFSGLLEINLDTFVQSTVLTHRGTAYMANNNYESALKDFIQADNLSPSFANCNYIAVCYMVFKNYEKAIKFFNISLKMNWEQPNALLGRAKAYFKLGNNEKALDNCNECLELSPNLESAIKLLALINQTGF